MTTLVKTRKNANAGEDRACADRIPRRHKGALDRIAKARHAKTLVGERLHDAYRADQFSGISRRIGERILGESRAAAHRTAEGIERQDDERDGAEHECRQPWARHHHHDAGSDEQHEVAQSNGYGSPDGGLDLRRVGREPRQHFAGPGFIEKGRRQRRHMGEHVAAQIGDDALTKRGDEVVAGGAREREHRRNADHDQEIVVDEMEAMSGKAEVDHAPHRNRNDQRRQCRQDQRHKRRQRPPAVALNVRQE